MDEKMNIIPAAVPMMDAGLAQFAAASEEAAMETVEKLMTSRGGKQVARKGNYFIYSFSNALKQRFITVQIDSAGPIDQVGAKPFTAVFREGNASTELMHYGLLLLALLVMGAICWVIRSWWSLLACPVVIALYLWLQYAPERAFVRKTVGIREELGR